LSSFSRGHLVSRLVFWAALQLSHGTSIIPFIIGARVSTVAIFTSRHFSRQPLATRTQAKDSREDLTTAVLEHSSESTVAKRELAKDL